MTEFNENIENNSLTEQHTSDLEIDENTKAYADMNHRRPVSGFRQRRTGANWSDPKGRTQTPRKRPRNYTNSPKSLNNTNSPGDNYAVEEDEAISQRLDTIYREISDMKEDMAELFAENQKLNERCTRIDNQARRNNMKIWNILEDRNETKFDIKRRVTDLFGEYGIKISPRDIDRVFRIGTRDYRGNTPRCTLVHFIHAEDKELVMSRGRHMFNDYRVRLENDYPPEIDENIKELRPLLQAAHRSKNEAGERCYKAKLIADRLTVNGKQYTVETVSKLPVDLRPENVSTPQKEGITSFFTKHSPLSNHHHATQKIDGETYNCNEQYYMQQKALTFADQATATQVMQETDPRIQKNLCKKFDKLDQKAWNEKRVNTMTIGLLAKFTQNAHLKAFLLKTGTTSIQECNRSDKFWGIGLSLGNPNIWKRNFWAGNAKNQLGILLMDLRTELKRE